MLTPEFILRMDLPFKPRRSNGGWCDGLETALPYWRQAHDAIIVEFFDELPDIWMEKYRFALNEIREIIIHLCEPDFRLRSDLKATEVNPSKYSLEKIVSRIDNLRSRLLVASRAR
jgi:hypothetical protein